MAFRYQFYQFIDHACIYGLHYACSCREWHGKYRISECALSIAVFHRDFFEQGKWMIYLSVTLFSTHLILQLIRFDDTPNEFYLEERIVGLFNMSLFIFVNIKLLFRNEQRNVYRIIGAVNVYLLFALIGAFALEILSIHTGRSIAGNVTLHNDDTDYAIYVYYSLVSLTTVGYGDIYPDGMSARMISVMLSAVGILYPAVIIVRLISAKK